MWIDWEIDTHTFPIIWVLFPIRFPSYGILHYMKNAGVSQSISLLGAFFPLDSHPMVCFIIWKMHRVSSSISHSSGKCNKTHHMGWTWKIGTYTFPVPQYGWFFPIRFPSFGILHQMGNGFPHQFPILQENVTKPIEWGEPGQLVLILFL